MSPGGPYDHLNRILGWTNSAVPKKYLAGAEEHGGNLWEKPVLREMESEIVDLIVYYHTHREQWERIRNLVEYGISQSREGSGNNDFWRAMYGHEALSAIANIMDYGNEEGKKSV